MADPGGAMGDVIFACDKDNYLARQTEFRGPKHQEYYDGDYLILPGKYVDVRIEKGLECAYPILKLRTCTDTIFKRNWNHIQQDKTDVTILWFVNRGHITISDCNGTNSIEAGECTITRSLQPFHMENHVDVESVNEVLHVIVPTHVMRSYIPDAIRTAAAFSFLEGNCHAAERTFAMLYGQGSRVDRAVAEELMRAAFTALGQGMSESSHPMPPCTLGERRLNDILACIETHLSNPDLTAAAVAERCGISNRYLCAIFKLRDTSFSEVLWHRRLEKTKTWLTSKNMNHLPIAKIAFMAGFKSAAHFSRMFKSAMKMTPLEFRGAHLGSEH